MTKVPANKKCWYEKKDDDNMKQGTYRINICVTKNHELKIHNNEIILSSFCVTPDRLLNCGEE